MSFKGFDFIKDKVGDYQYLFSFSREIFSGLRNYSGCSLYIP
jgi:hypothetical protein